MQPKNSSQKKHAFELSSETLLPRIYQIRGLLLQVQTQLSYVRFIVPKKGVNTYFHAHHLLLLLLNFK